LEGKMIVFSTNLSPSSLERRKNELAGYGKETLQLSITNDEASFAHYQPEEI
jgi:hypothetical protein